MAHEIQVVRDQQHRHAALLRFVALQFKEQFHDLRANRHVERGSRFVGKQQTRTARQRHRDHRPLALSARKLVRVAVHALARLGNARAAQQRDRALAGFRRRHAVVHDDRLRDLRADRVERIERGHRLLKDHRDVRAAHAAHLTLAFRKQILTVEPDRAADLRVAQQTQDRQRGDAFSRARFADERNAFAALDRQRDVVHRHRIAKTHMEMIEFQQRHGIRCFGAVVPSPLALSWRLRLSGH